MLISASKCSKTSSYWHQLAQEITLLSVSKLHEKRITESQEGRNFGGTRGLIESFTRLQLYNCVTWKMHSFSAKQARVIFSPISLFMKSWVTAIGEINFLQFPLYSVDDDKSPTVPPKNPPLHPPPPSTSNSRGFMKRRISTPQNYFRNKLELLHEGPVTLKTYASSVKEHRKLVNCLPIGWIEWKEKWLMIDLRKLVFWLLHLLSSLPVFVL